MDEENPVSAAFDVLKTAMAEDPEYAWGWHCSIACSAMDEGLDKSQANHIAGRVMYMAFKVDTARIFPDRMPYPERAAVLLAPVQETSIWNCLEDE